MTSLSEKMQAYAELALKIGVYLQPDQNLYVETSVETLELAQMVMKKAYELGARSVFVEITDDELTRLRLQHAPEVGLKDVPQWKVARYQAIVDEHAALLNIYTPNADLLKDVDPDRIAMSTRAAAAATEFFSAAVVKGDFPWTMISAPTKAWAAKVFPELDEETAMASLWDAILKICRVDTADPVEAWKRHNEDLTRRANYLNEKKYRKFHYRGPGTDLVIGFHEKHQWEGGEWVKENGTRFLPNMPTEEIFSIPLKHDVNGVVRNTKPLNYQGNTIDGFTLTFKDGRVVEFSAEQGYDILKNLIEMDDGAHYLGEVALVPHHSPISDTNLLFYNTLFDENASCHLAIGRALPTCLEGGGEMDEAQLEAHGCNISLTHVDFMIGSADLDIDGITADGEVEPIFRNGNWAF